MNARTKARLAKEREILQQYLPAAKIQFPNDAARACVLAVLNTQRHNRYVLWIPLGAFPNEPPKMYVVEPAPLRDHRGKKLSKLGISSSMHLLTPDAHGHPQICHYRDDAWTPNVTLFKVVLKGLLWLEAYDLHKAKGKAIDQYLPEMKTSTSNPFAALGRLISW